MSVNQKIQDLNIILPNAPTPVGAYSAFKKINNLIFISGQLPIDINGKLIKGKVGSDITLEQAQKASLLSCLNIIAQLKTACDGDLELVKNCIKITGFVNSIDKFEDQPKVINPASELITNIFGQKGIHTRAAVSVNSLPLGVCVEIDAIFEI